MGTGEGSATITTTNASTKTTEQVNNNNNQNTNNKNTRVLILASDSSSSGDDLSQLAGVLAKQKIRATRGAIRNGTGNSEYIPQTKTFLGKYASDLRGGWVSEIVITPHGHVQLTYHSPQCWTFLQDPQVLPKLEAIGLKYMAMSLPQLQIDGPMIAEYLKSYDLISKSGMVTTSSGEKINIVITEDLLRNALQLPHVPRKHRGERADELPLEEILYMRQYNSNGAEYDNIRDVATEKTCRAISMLLQVKPADRYNRISLNRLYKVHLGLVDDWAYQLKREVDNYLKAHDNKVANPYLLTKVLHHACEIQAAKNMKEASTTESFIPKLPRNVKSIKPLNEKGRIESSTVDSKLDVHIIGESGTMCPNLSFTSSKQENANIIQSGVTEGSMFMPKDSDKTGVQSEADLSIATQLPTLSLRTVEVETSNVSSENASSLTPDNLVKSFVPYMIEHTETVDAAVSMMDKCKEEGQAAKRPRMSDQKHGNAILSDYIGSKKGNIHSKCSENFLRDTIKGMEQSIKQSLEKHLSGNVNDRILNENVIAELHKLTGIILYKNQVMQKHALWKLRSELSQNCGDNALLQEELKNSKPDPDPEISSTEEYSTICKQLMDTLKDVIDLQHLWLERKRKHEEVMNAHKAQLAKKVSISQESKFQDEVSCRKKDDVDLFPLTRPSNMDHQVMMTDDHGKPLEEENLEIPKQQESFWKSNELVKHLIDQLALNQKATREMQTELINTKCELKDLRSRVDGMYRLLLRRSREPKHKQNKMISAAIKHVRVTKGIAPKIKK